MLQEKWGTRGLRPAADHRVMRFPRPPDAHRPLAHACGVLAMSPGCVDVEDRHRPERLRWIEPDEVLLVLHGALNRLARLLRRSTELENDVEADQVHGHRLNRLWRRRARILSGIGIDRQLVSGPVTRIGVFAREHFAVEGPAARRCPDVAMGRTVSFRHERATPDARDLLRHSRSRETRRTLPQTLRAINE